MASETRLLDEARAHLEPGERILAAVEGTETRIMSPDSVRNGLLIATDRRVMFYAKRFTGYDLASYPYATITSIDQGKNMMGHKVTFHAAVDKIEVKWIKDADKLARFIETTRSRVNTARASDRPAVGSPAPPPHGAAHSPAPDAPGSEVAELLASLARLRDAEVLTEDEFAAKKAQLLERL